MEKKPKKLDRNVVLTGFTSFFTDISSEMIYPLLQGFISVVMRTQAAFLGPVLGMIEGIAESTASLLKVTAGYYSDRINQRKAPTIFGYGFSSLSKLLYFIPFWGSILLARFFDRVGKGIRTAPRDAIISESTHQGDQGRAFGFHRAMDFAGAVLGTIISLFLITLVYPRFDVLAKTNAKVFYPIFLIALLPAVLAVLFLFFIKEKRGAETVAENGVESGEKPKPNLDIRKYDRNLKLFFLAQFLFTLGNSSNQFLLLRSGQLGFQLSTVLIFYILFNLVTALFSTLFGQLSDRIGRKKLLVTGYALYAVVYGAFGFIKPDTSFMLWVFWPLYGLYYAMTEGVEKAFVTDIAPRASKATALGFFHTIVGVGLLPASLIAGFLFTLHPGAPFLFGGVMAAASLLVIVLAVKEG